MILKKYLKYSAILIGALAGYAYYYFVGCQSGSCPIQGNPLFQHSLRRVARSAINNAGVKRKRKILNKTLLSKHKVKKRNQVLIFKMVMNVQFFHFSPQSRWIHSQFFGSNSFIPVIFL